MKRPGPSGGVSGIDSDQHFQMLVDAVTEYAIYSLDRDGFITSWNKGAERIKGYKASEAIGQHFSRFLPDAERAKGTAPDILQIASSDGRYLGEGWRVRKDGSQFWANVTVQPIRDSAGELVGFTKITRDMTIFKEAEIALRDSENRFRLLVEGVTDYAIYMLDPSGIVTNWNEGARRLKGYEAHEIVGEHFSRFYRSEDRMAGLPAQILRIAAQDGRFEAEGWRVRKDGTQFWASVVIDALRDDAGNLRGFAKITRDNSERRAVEEALRESERRFRLLVSGVTDYALYMLDPNGIVTNWNAGAERIKLYSADEIVGQHFSRFYTEADRASGLPAHALMQAVTEGRFEAEGWRVRKDGTQFWASVVIDTIKDETGILIGFAKITRDITDKREAQLSKQRADAERAHIQKMEMLGQLTGGVAHDFNNLLMVVSGQTELIKRRQGDDPKIARATSAIGQAIERGVSLTRQLLSFSRRQTLTPVEVSLDERLVAFRTMMTSSLGGAVTLSILVRKDIWPVKIDVSEFELALLNLSINARDAMQQGGTITVTAENMHVSEGEVPSLSDGDFVALTLADSGTGIAPDILERVFDPFFTTKGPEKGSGLGLSQVHGFVHQSGGTITIASELGSGTRITLYFPRAETVSEAESSAQARGDIAASGKMLLVEDNPDVAAVTADMIEHLGYGVSVVQDADGALAYLARETVTLVVSDIVMAGALDGLGLAQEIRRLYPATPVILISGYSSPAAAAAREFAVLRKPFQLADLHRAIQDMLAADTSNPSNLVYLRPRKSP